MSDKCPNCGHCPHCGRSNFGPYRPFPYTQPWFGQPHYVGDVWPYPNTSPTKITYTSSSTNIQNIQ